MKINFSKQQYKDILRAVGASHAMHEMLADSLESSDWDYESSAAAMHDLESYLLEFANAFGVEEAAEEVDGEFIMNEEFYAEEVEPVLSDYEEFALYDRLSNDLAWRDLEAIHSPEELDKMAEKNGDFFAVELAPHEERYLKEFEKFGIARLHVKEDETFGHTPSPYL